MIRWYTSGSSERYLLEYLESFPGGASRRTRCGNGVAAAAIAAAAAIDRADARRSGVANRPGDQGRSSAGGVLARRHRRLLSPVRGNRRRHWPAADARGTDRREEGRWQVVRGPAVPVLRLLPG